MERRPATSADRGAVLDLGVIEEVAWFGAAEISPDEVAEWLDSEGGIEPGAVAIDDSAGVRGFASAGRLAPVFMADPAHTDEVADVLLPWLGARRDDVELMTFGSDAARVAAFERHGLRHVRSSLTLARPAAAGPLPPPAFPDGVDVAPYRPEEEDEAVHHLLYVDAAWASVPGHTERDLDTWRQLSAPLHSSFLARRDGRPIGWIGGRIFESGRGYVQTIAVAESERGRGLGRALLLHGFADLLRAGASDLGLDVVAANEGALSLYRSVGLEVEREWRFYGR